MKVRSRSTVLRRRLAPRDATRCCLGSITGSFRLAYSSYLPTRCQNACNPPNMAPSLEHEVDIGQISIAKYSNNPPSPDRKKSAGDTGRQNGRHQRRMSSMSHPDLSELKAIDGPTSPSRSHLTRSKTMPRHAMNPLANAPELDGLPVDHTKLPKLRRWMLAFVLGKC